MNAVHFGAGNIGRGFLGQLYFESGFDTVFIESRPEIVSAVNLKGGYRIHLAEASPLEIQVERVRAIHSEDREAVARAIAEADIASTAVGVSVLDQIAPLIAEGLRQRWIVPDSKPLDIIVCENLLHAGPALRDAVRKELVPELWPKLDSTVGFVEASIGRMVPRVPDDLREADPLYVAVEAYCELPVDGEAFRGPIPAIRHLKPIQPFGAYVERKLYVHNAGHAVCAYLGWLAGLATIDEAMDQPAIATVTRGAMLESARALHLRHGLDFGELHEHVEDLVRRFRNPALGDQIVRVAADPIRKLGPQDRLLGAIGLCLEQGVDPQCLVIGTQAALAYREPSDGQAVELQSRIEREGMEAVTRSLCPSNAIAARIVPFTKAQILPRMPEAGPSA